MCGLTVTCHFPRRFSFCQFPFILSTVVKKSIIQKDSEQQMISQARVRNLHRTQTDRMHSNRSCTELDGLCLTAKPGQ